MRLIRLRALVFEREGVSARWERLTYKALGMRLSGVLLDIEVIGSRKRAIEYFYAAEDAQRRARRRRR